MRPWRWAGKLDAALGFPAFFNPRWRSHLDDVVRNVKADVILVRDLPLTPAAISAGKRHCIPVILDLAEHYPAMMRALWDTGRQEPLDWLIRNPKVVEWVERFCLKRVDLILIVADEMKDRVAAMGIERSRITRVGNTPSKLSRRAPTRVTRRDDEPLHLVYLGLLEVVRGIEDMIDAVALLRGEGLSVDLRIIGTGRDEPLFRDLALARSLSGNEVEFAGYIPYARAMELVAQADIRAPAVAPQ